MPEAQILLLLHDAVYHQCQIVLHSMVVPLFSGTPTDPNVDPETQRKAAETVTHHADLFERLLAPYLYDRKDVSRLPPLVGYGAFVVGIVILSTDISRRNQSVSEPPVNAGKMDCRLVAVEAILRLIDTLRVYWRALQHPVSVFTFPDGLCVSSVAWFNICKCSGEFCILPCRPAFQRIESHPGQLNHETVCIPRASLLYVMKFWKLKYSQINHRCILTTTARPRHWKDLINPWTSEVDTHNLPPQTGTRENLLKKRNPQLRVGIMAVLA